MVRRGVRYIYVFDSFGLRTTTSTGSASWNNGITFSVGGNGIGGSRAPSGSRWKSVHVYDRALTMKEIHRNYEYERLKFNI